MALRERSARSHLEPLNGPLAASHPLRSAHATSGDSFEMDGDGAPPLPLPALSAEERELLLLVLQEAPSEAVGGSSDSNGDGSGAGHRRVDVLSESDSAESADSSGRQRATRNEATTARTLSTARRSKDDPKAEQQQQQEKTVKVNPRRNRKRRKHEVDALRIEAKELASKLQQLQQTIQEQQQQQSAQTGSDGMLVAKSVVITREEGSDDDSQSQQQQQWIVIKKEKAQSSSASIAETSIWESLAWFQREEARTAIQENAHLKTLYQYQLQALRELEGACNAQMSPLNGELSYWLHHELSNGGAGALTKRARTSPFDDDFAIFASLGHDFDAQYVKTDAIIASAGLTSFDGRFHSRMVPKRGANGIYFLESVRTKMLPYDMHIHDARIWDVLGNEDLHAHHTVYEVRDRTSDTMFRKIVNPIYLPHAEATLIRRTALKRYIEVERIVLVWDTVIEIAGSVSMRLRERGWKLMRKPHAVPAQHIGGPLSVEQSVSRITPELSSTYSEQDIAAGSLTNTIVSSYHRHLKMFHHLNRDVFIAMFGKLSLHEPHGHCQYRRKKCHPASDAPRPTPPSPQQCDTRIL